MKVGMLIGACVCFLQIPVLGMSQQEQEDQLRQEIEACWNDHKKMMGDLQSSFKKSEEERKKESASPNVFTSKIQQTESAPVVQDDPGKLEEVAEVQEEIETPDLHSISTEPQEVVGQKEVEVQQPSEVKVERASRSKALQRAQQELQEHNLLS